MCSMCYSFKIIRLYMGELLSSDLLPTPKVRNAVSCGLRTQGVRCGNGAVLGRAISPISCSYSYFCVTLYLVLCVQKGLVERCVLNEACSFISSPLLLFSTTINFSNVLS